MARSRSNPARLVVALAIAMLLAVFLVYTALSGTTPALQPSNLAGHDGKVVSLTGKVTAIVPGSDAHTPAGLQFKLHNINGVSPTIPIVYHGSVPGSLQDRTRRERDRRHERRRIQGDRAHDQVPEQVHRLADLIHG